MSDPGLHPSARGFATSADTYQRGRPGYPQEAIELIARRCDLRPGRRVLDLGAGTGKFTRALISTGAAIIALEPISAMRRTLHPQLPRARVIGATAESIPLRAASVSGVTAAQSFHWFRVDQTAAEIHRVLTDEGILALVWNVRDPTDQLQAQVSEIIEPFRKGTPAERDRAWLPRLRATGLFGDPDVKSFRSTQRIDLHGLIDRVTSISYIAALLQTHTPRWSMPSVRSIREPAGSSISDTEPTCTCSTARPRRERS